MNEIYKACVSCRYARRDFSDAVTCIHESVPVVTPRFALSVAKDFFCRYWDLDFGQREPSEYRPGDGPFYALRLSSTRMDCTYEWTIYLGLHRDGDPVFGGNVYNEAGARGLVDALNRACREWAAEHAQPHRRQLAEIVIGTIATAPERRIIIGVNAATVHVTVRTMERKAELDWGTGRCYVEPDKIWLRYSDTESRWQNAGTGACYEESIHDDCD